MIAMPIIGAVIALIAIVFCLHSALTIKDSTISIAMMMLAVMNAYTVGRLIRIIVDTIQTL